MKKKTLLTILLALACCSLVACGGDSDDTSVPQESVSASESSETSESAEESESTESSETSESAEVSESSESAEVSESTESSESAEQTEIYYMVSFDTAGGNTIASIMVLSGEKVEKPQNPNRSTDYGEYEFLYWQYNGEEWDFENDVVTENMTLVAKWKAVDSYTPPFLPKE